MRQGSILAFLKPQMQVTTIENADSTIHVADLGSQPSLAHSGEAQQAQQAQSTNRKPLSKQSPPANLIQSAIDPRATIEPLRNVHIERVRMITATLLPVRYSDKFFTECLEPEKHAAIAFVTTYDSSVVGWIRCRIEPFPNAENEVYQQLYVQALGLLAPYRSLGLATELLKAAVANSGLAYSQVRSISAHVWESNQDALIWYDKQGFKRVLLQAQYYRRLKPAGAWLMRKEIG